MARTKTLALVLAVLVSAFVSGLSSAAEPVKPKPKDKCPVCGMFVAPYPNWTAEILFKDGGYAVFDGPKDMLKFYFGMATYDKAHTPSDVAELFVTEYYTVRMMPAKEVLFVTGSNVMGPMGPEMVPVRGKREAETFRKDHGGSKVLPFGRITAKDLP